MSSIKLTHTSTLTAHSVLAERAGKVEEKKRRGMYGNFIKTA
jgi:hypothetical protein